MTDRNLEEAIFQLQKLNAENGVKQLVEEAAQLFADGRHMEASALMEKAEALVAARSGRAPGEGLNVATPVSSPADGAKPGERVKVDGQVMANVAVRLADGLSKILTGAFEELELHVIGESRKISSSFEHQLDRLQATVEGLTHLQGKLGELSTAVFEQRSAAGALGQQYEQLSASVMGLDAASARHEGEIGALRGETTAIRGETKELSTAVVQQVDAISARLGLHQEEMAGLKSTVSEISRKVAGFVERVDRQGEVLRAITDTHARRAAALDELLGVITRLKAPAETVVAAAGHL